MLASYGKYQVLEQVGEGGFGRVYRALDPLLKRDVAIKTCTLRQPDVRARFVREAEIVASLKHPNIVTVYDFGVEDGEPYLVQEFLSGADLAQVMASGAVIDLATKVAWLRQIAAGLLHAHGQGVIHRDVKPSNIRIQADGDVRIMDFGIAKLLEAEQQLTQTGMSIGTTGYLAPEQLTGREIDHRVDIFSFGVLAYELLSGRKPFAAENMTAALYRIVHEQPAPLGELAPDCPASLVACIERCLEKDRDRRWASFGPVRGELEELARRLDRASPEPELSAVSRVATVPLPEARTRRISPAVAGLATATLAIALFGVVMLSRQAWSDPGSAGAAAIPIAPAPVAPPATQPDPPDTNGGTAGPEGPEARNGAGSGSPPAPPPPPASPPASTPPANPPAAPPPPVANAALDDGRLVVLVSAADIAVHDAAEAVVLTELEGAGFTIVDRTMVEGSPAGAASPNALVALGRAHGAGHVLFIEATADAVASVGGMFTGSATVVVRAYDSAGGSLAANRSASVGSAGVPGRLAATPDAARLDATRAAAYRAAREVIGRLRD